MMKSRGALLVFEGCDRSGKTTQTQRCVEALRKSGVKVASASPWRFPDRTTPIGKMIDSYLQGTSDIDSNALHLLFSANRWEKHAAIVKALENGETLVVDRYAYSGVAYSIAKGLDGDWCKNADCGLVRPDVVVYLDLPWEVAKMRGGCGEERYEKEVMQKKVANVFREMVGVGWRVVNADQSPDQVHNDVMDAVMKAVRDASEGAPIRKLWDTTP